VGTYLPTPGAALRTAIGLETPCPQSQEEEYSVYGIVHSIDLQAIYVGITTDIEQRRKQHFSQKAWIREMIEKDMPPITIPLEPRIHGIRLARKYEAYWIQDLLKKGHPLQNIQGNPQRKGEYLSAFQWEFITLPKEEQRQLLAINTLGITHFGLRYGEVFLDLYHSACSKWSINADKYWVKLAEVALRLCEIPQIDDDDEDIREAVREWKRLMAEEGMSEDEAGEKVM